MKRIFSIIMELGLGLPTGTISFWGTLVPRILTVDYTFKLNDVSKTTHMSCVDAVMHNDEMTTSENILVQIEQNKSRFRMLLLINIGSVQD